MHFNSMMLNVRIDPSTKGWSQVQKLFLCIATKKKKIYICVSLLLYFQEVSSQPVIVFRMWTVNGEHSREN